MINKSFWSTLILIFLIVTKISFAAEEFLPEPQEKRAQQLFLQVKCLVCEGQVIESSNTEIAFEMRQLIREKIKNGWSDEEIKKYLVDNYGNKILTAPPLENQTILLWLLPMIFFLTGIVGLWLIFRKKKS